MGPIVAPKFWKLPYSWQNPGFQNKTILWGKWPTDGRSSEDSPWRVPLAFEHHPLSKGPKRDFLRKPYQVHVRIHNTTLGRRFVASYRDCAWSAAQALVEESRELQGTVPKARSQQSWQPQTRAHKTASHSPCTVLCLLWTIYCTWTIFGILQELLAMTQRWVPRNCSSCRFPLRTQWRNSGVCWGRFLLRQSRLVCSCRAPAPPRAYAARP